MGRWPSTSQPTHASTHASAGSSSSSPASRCGDVASREELLAEAATPEAAAIREAMQQFFDLCDTEEVAPSTGLTTTTREFTSQPDGNTIKLQVIRPDTDEALPCVYYIHGGGMAAMSCFYGMYRAWGRIIAANGVAVVMPDFRNCVAPSSAPEVAPFPAGLNDCVSGLHWASRTPTSSASIPAQIVVAGESGGGNLTLATGLALKRDGDLGLIKGLYALCPYIAGQWPAPDSPSSIENEGILLRLHNNRGAMGYGIEAFEARNPARLALLRTGRRRPRLPAHRHQRQRVRPAARRGHQLLPPPPGGGRARPAAAR